MKDGQVRAEPSALAPVGISVAKVWLALISKTGQLLDASIPGSGTCVIVHDPWRPAPAIGGHLSPTAGPCDRKLVDQRSDVAVFSSAPLQSSLQLCGRPAVETQRVCRPASL